VHQSSKQSKRSRIRRVKWSFLCPPEPFHFDCRHQGYRSRRDARDGESLVSRCCHLLRSTQAVRPSRRSPQSRSSLLCCTRWRRPTFVAAVNLWHFASRMRCQHSRQSQTPFMGPFSQSPKSGVEIACGPVLRGVRHIEKSAGMPSNTMAILRISLFHPGQRSAVNSATHPISEFAVTHSAQCRDLEGNRSRSRHIGTDPLLDECIGNKRPLPYSSRGISRMQSRHPALPFQGRSI
jgi:hypothetical protein